MSDQLDLATIFAFAPDVILIVDHSGVIQSISPVVSGVLGHDVSEMIGHNASEFVYGPDLEGTRDEMRRMRRSNHQMQNFMCRYVHKSGDIIRIAWNGVWLVEEKRYLFIGRQVSSSLELIEHIGQRLSDLEHIIDNRIHSLEKQVGIGPWRDKWQSVIGEVALAISSFWIAWVLHVPPANFHQFPSAFWMMLRAGTDEQFWSTLAFTAAAVKLIGAGLFFGPVILRGAALPCRIFGMGMSSVLWFLLGLSAVTGNPDTLFGFSGMMVGMYSIWHLLRLSRAE